MCIEDGDMTKQKIKYLCEVSNRFQTIICIILDRVMKLYRITYKPIT